MNGVLTEGEGQGWIVLAKLAFRVRNQGQLGVVQGKSERGNVLGRKNRLSQMGWEGAGRGMRDEQGVVQVMVPNGFGFYPDSNEEPFSLGK